MTYSLVARDPETGELGVAVQSRSFRTGSVVPWAAAGVGAVATQSFSLRSYGPKGLALLGEGASPEAVLSTLTGEDELRDFRQVGVVDALGRTAAYTGAACIPAAGSTFGDGYSAQGNMLASDNVVPALAAGFETTTGTLAERLLAALEAAEAAGGDFRGREAGAILVVGGDADDPNADSPLSDLRVDNHPDPLGELRRLLNLEQALRSLRRADGARLDEAVAEARAAGADDDVIRWVAAVGQIADDPERAREWIAPLAAAVDRWTIALDRASSMLEQTRG